MITTSVVEVTEDDLRDAMRKGGVPPEYTYYSIARDINERLRARATPNLGPTGSTLGAGWVHVPTREVVGELVVPALTTTLVHHDDGAWRTAWRTFGPCSTESPLFPRALSYRVVADDGTTGPIIERTTTTVREWTADSVFACVKKSVVMRNWDGDLSTWECPVVSALDIACTFNDDRIARYYILPPCEVTP